MRDVAGWERERLCQIRPDESVTDLMSACRPDTSSFNLLASFNMLSRSSFIRRQNSAANSPHEQQSHNSPLDVSRA